jgi:hypothetical protein
VPECDIPLKKNTRPGFSPASIGSQITAGAVSINKHACLRACSYKTAPGRSNWPNRDPINELVIRSQNPFNLDEEKNLYSFVNNDPVGRVDPVGLHMFLQSSSCNAVASKELEKTYKEMKEKDVRGTDQFFHCLAACRATRAAAPYCCGGRKAAEDMVRSLLNTKELRDYLLNVIGLYGDKRLSHDEMMEDIARDKAANEQGIKAPKEKSCEQSCISLLDGLPEHRRKFMEDYFKK